MGFLHVIKIDKVPRYGNSHYTHTWLVLAVLPQSACLHIEPIFQTLNEQREKASTEAYAITANAKLHTLNVLLPALQTGPEDHHF